LSPVSVKHLNLLFFLCSLLTTSIHLPPVITLQSFSIYSPPFSDTSLLLGSTKPSSSTLNQEDQRLLPLGFCC
jgi:hypothetical protein